MSLILKIIRRFKGEECENKKKIKKADWKECKKEEIRQIFEVSCPSSLVSVTAVTSASPSLTTVSSSIHPMPKVLNILKDKKSADDITDTEEQKSYITTDKHFDFIKEKYTNDTINSLKYSKEIMSENYNNKNTGNEKLSSNSTSTVKMKLTEDYTKLMKKNTKLKTQFQKTHSLNEKLKKQIYELEELNQKLLSDNTEVLQEAIKHRFLKLESEDLSKKTNQYKQKLEEKENVIVNFQKQYENLKVKNNLAYKRKEEALLEASHSHIKLKELAKDCAELDIYKCESLQRKYYFNELQNIVGTIRVYLRVKPTVRESCVSFLTDDKILISTDDKKPKNLICQFTKVFQPHHNNADIFDEIHPLLTTVIDGYNCTFINYGQKGSGKSYTFFGDDKNPGILFRSFQYLIATISEMNNEKYSLFVSAIEIYKDNVVDVYRKKPVQVIDDGSNLILKNTEEKIIKNIAQCSQVLNVIVENRTCVEDEDDERYTGHLVVIIRVTSISENVTEESCCGVAMLCDLAGFENEKNLCTKNRSMLKEEKILHDTLIDLGKTLVSLKSKHKRLPPPNTILTKLLQPCLGNHSKCCLFIHSLCEKDHHEAIVKSIQYGLAIMPKQKEKINERKDVIQWEFCDNDL